MNTATALSVFFSWIGLTVFFFGLATVIAMVAVRIREALRFPKHRLRSRVFRWLAPAIDRHLSMVLIRWREAGNFLNGTQKAALARFDQTEKPHELIVDNDRYDVVHPSRECDGSCPVGVAIRVLYSEPGARTYLPGRYTVSFRTDPDGLVLTEVPA